MPVTTGSVRWYPERLNAAIASGFKASLAEAEALARAKSPSSKAGVRLVPKGTTAATLEPTGLGGIFEKGRKGGELIQPIKKQALKVGSGFAAYVTEGPMAPDPYIRPAATEWANGIAQAQMRATLAGAGFR